MTESTQMDVIKGRIDLVERALKSAQETFDIANRTLEQAKDQFAEEVAKLESERTTPRRNWPEKVEAGMCFRAYGSVIITTGTSTDLSMVSAVSIAGKSHGTTCYKWDKAPDLEYLGHARDRIKIIEDAHEPTGAELVGAMEKVLKRARQRFIDIQSAWDRGFGKEFILSNAKAGEIEIDRIAQ